VNARPRLARARRDGVWLIEDRRARADGLLVVFADRRGGISPPPFDSLNLAARGGDDPRRARANRARVARAAGFDADRLVLARQVHGARVIEAGEGAAGVLGEADGLVARGPGPVLGMLTADCAAVVVAGADGVALLHAGWRGLAAGIVEEGVASVAQARAAWIGPAIRSCCYPVGDEVVAALAARGLPARRGRVDVPAAARAALRRAGVARVAMWEECTSCSPHLFSFRRDGMTGRQGAFAAVLQP